MRRIVILWWLVVMLLFCPRGFCQGYRSVIDTSKIYITSFFDCAVYWGNRRIATLRNGTRAQILESRKKWILVRFWSGGKYVTGWIRR